MLEAIQSTADATMSETVYNNHCRYLVLTSSGRSSTNDDNEIIMFSVTVEAILMMIMK